MKKYCCICGKEIESWGNNPDGAAWKDSDTNEIVMPEFKEEDRCCDECNMAYVIPGRLYRIKHRN